MTIVEALVVTGIVFLLISMIVPAIGRSRQTAERVACLAELRDTGQVLAMYATDDDGVWPSAMEFNAADQIWAVRFRNRLYNRSHQPPPQDYLAAMNTWHGPLIDLYFDGNPHAGALYCPSDADGVRDAESVYAMRDEIPGEHRSSIGRLTSTALHVDPSILSEDGPLAGRMQMRTTRVHEMRFPSRTATVYESSLWHHAPAFTDSPGTRVEGYSSHTVLAGDGAAAFRSKEDAALGVMFTNLHDGLWEPGIPEFERRILTAWNTTGAGVRGRDW